VTKGFCSAKVRLEVSLQKVNDLAKQVLRALVLMIELIGNLGLFSLIDIK